MAARKKTKKTTADPDGADALPFEKALDDLEKIVERLEQGEVSLDESLKLYEQGVKAFRLCRKILDRAEKRIQVLVRDPDGSLSLRDVKAGDDEDGAGNLLGNLEGENP